MSLEAKLVVLGTQAADTEKTAPYSAANTYDSAPASTTNIWDTAGQERYRSISALYYRSANCGILCYDITSLASFEAMHSWLQELKKNVHGNIIIHIVGTKADLVNAEPARREVAFEKCLAFAEEHLGEGGGWGGWGDCCHEISARDDQGVDEVFQVIARKLVERRADIERERAAGVDYARRGGGGNGNGNVDPNAVGAGEKGRSGCC
ncbi:ras-domain-containing protein [Choiromyces venosus 120613-1]|uniref:Ras-domain-containing protein n=1 Tax=Choiromyces venosus 120613-1 TaxID=1336337 RepID=A0A3N4JM11_9PEZI|nr:ras-domain-containing protein [Choiromyces venosus 120613-1]